MPLDNPESYLLDLKESFVLRVVFSLGEGSDQSICSVSAAVQLFFLRSVS